MLTVSVTSAELTSTPHSLCLRPGSAFIENPAVIGVVKDGMQWSEGDSWPIGERAEGAGTVGGVEREG